MRLLRRLHMSDVSGYLVVSAKLSCCDIMCKSIPGSPPPILFVVWVRGEPGNEATQIVAMASVQAGRWSSSYSAKGFCILVLTRSCALLPAFVHPYLVSQATPFAELRKGVVTLQPLSCRHSRNLIQLIRSALFVDCIRCHGITIMARA